MFAPPAVAGDLVFVASCSGAAYALRRETGEPVWSYDTAIDGGVAEFHGSPLVTPGLIIAATDDRKGNETAHVYAFERLTGLVRWKRPVGSGVMTDLVRSGDALYYGTLREHLESLRIDSGELVWSVDTRVANDDFFPTSTPIVTADRVVFGGVDGTVRALDRVSGKQLWSRPLGARVSTNLVRAQKSLYAGTADGKFHRLRLDDGTVRGSYPLRALPFGRPVVTNGAVILVTTGGGILALSRGLDHLGWESRIESDWSGFRPVVVSGLVLAGADDGKLYAFRVSDGSQAWFMEFGAPVTTLSVDGDTLYVGTSGGLAVACRKMNPSRD